MKQIFKSLTAIVIATCVAGPAMAAGAGGSSGQSGTGSAKSGTPAPKALGQPNDSCGSASAPFTPGNAAAAFGSAFNPMGIAGTMYAGQQPQNSNNPAAVSQYDVACANQ